MIERETFAAIVAQLKPAELMVAVLRLEGLSDDQIGRLLGTSRETVCRRMSRARARIARQVPGAAGLLDGRRLPPGPRPGRRALEHGWLCPQTHAAPPLRKPPRSFPTLRAGELVDCEPPQVFRDL